MKEHLLAYLASFPALAGVPLDWGSRAQGTGYPGIVLNVVSDSSGQTFGGPMDLSKSRVQVDVYAKTYPEATSVARSIRAALERYRGGPVEGVYRMGERDGREGGTNEAERPFRISQDFDVVWRVQ